jgi:glycosyltransferase involved in cell wall biosynthesis
MKTEKSLHVLFLSSWYPNRRFPQNGNFVQNHARAVALYNRVSVLYVIPDSNSKKWIELVRTKGEINEWIVYVRKAFILRELLTIFAYFKYYFKIKKESGKPNILHVNVIWQVGVIALIFNKLFGIKYIITEHSSAYLPFRKDLQVEGIRLKITQLIAKNASVLAPVTQNLATEMQKKNITCKRYLSVPNVFNENIFKSKPNGIYPTKRIIHISNLADDAKNFTGILHVISKLQAQRSDFILDIVTNSKYERWVELAKQLNINSKHLFFEGPFQSSEIAERLQQSNFLLLFSNYESFPVVIVESLACGRPVIATRVGGIAEHIDNEKGILTKPGNEAMLLDAINYMLDNYQKYDSEKLANYAYAHFSYAQVGKQFSEIYHQALND